MSSMENKNHISNDEFVDFSQFLKDVSGIDLAHNKTYLVTSRLSAVMKNHDIGEYKDLLEMIKNPSHADLRDEVIDAMTTNETNWFRDQHPFRIFKEAVLKNSFEDGKKNLKIWSAACSSGQEPNTISMCVSEFLEENRGAFPDGVKIVATDISSTMLQKASTSSYDEFEMNRGLSEERVSKFFHPAEDGFCQLNDNERHRVDYRYLNLLHSFDKMGKYDVIFCRNVLIYFAKETRIAIINKFSECLNSGGFLILGASESVSRENESFTMVNFHPGIAFQKI